MSEQRRFQPRSTVYELMSVSDEDLRENAATATGNNRVSLELEFNSTDQSTVIVLRRKRGARFVMPSQYFEYMMARAGELTRTIRALEQAHAAKESYDEPDSKRSRGLTPPQHSSLDTEEANSQWALPDYRPKSLVYNYGHGQSMRQGDISS